MKPYMPPEEIINKLNEAGLWHGRAAVLERADVVEQLKADPFDRWNNPYLLPLFQGLYVTDNSYEAGDYAEKATNAIIQHYGGMELAGDWAVPEVHKITLLPGSTIALDEDEFYWPVVANSYEHGLLLKRDEDIPYRELQASPKVAELAKIGSFGGQLDKAIRRVQKEQESDPEDLVLHDLTEYEYATEVWNPNEMKDAVAKLATRWTKPILETWAQLPWTERASQINPYFNSLPNLVLLDSNWVAEPPLMDRWGAYPQGV